MKYADTRVVTGSVGWLNHLLLSAKRSDLKNLKGEGVWM